MKASSHTSASGSGFERFPQIALGKSLRGDQGVIRKLAPAPKALTPSPAAAAWPPGRPLVSKGDASLQSGLGRQGRNPRFGANKRAALWLSRDRLESGTL